MKFRSLILVLLAFAASTGAFAQSAGSNLVQLGWIHLAPQESSEPLRIQGNAVRNSGASIDSPDTVGIAITHFLTDHIAVESVAGFPPRFDLSGTGVLASPGINPLANARQWSPALLMKYYLGDVNSKLRPSLGIGASYIWFSHVHVNPAFQRSLSELVTSGATTAAPSSATVDSTWAPVFEAGLTYNLDKHWSVAASVSYLPFSTKAHVTTTLPTGTQVHSDSKLTINPIVTYLAVGYRF
ncbi:OmpW/AlkL family protein [Burkholderia cenocepacia]|uniref:OmpW/AlkL family protein n=1 Tax=Burkholderia cenocepacia TaxID=95486 RepID=UPI002862A4DC|nr:OmpW family outer membrane protein [Burkholderia cenocepacia]MDR8052896.1 outer membrane beta-barrel protein [Burkholderia cenocepacia]